MASSESNVNNLNEDNAQQERDNDNDNLLKGSETGQERKETSNVLDDLILSIKSKVQEIKSKHQKEKMPQLSETVTANEVIRPKIEKLFHMPKFREIVEIVDPENVKEISRGLNKNLNLRESHSDSTSIINPRQAKIVYIYDEIKSMNTVKSSSGKISKSRVYSQPSNSTSVIKLPSKLLPVKARPMQKDRMALNSMDFRPSKYTADKKNDIRISTQEKVKTKFNEDSNANKNKEIIRQLSAIKQDKNILSKSLHDIPQKIKEDYKMNSVSTFKPYRSFYCTNEYYTMELNNFSSMLFGMNDIPLSSHPINHLVSRKMQCTLKKTSSQRKEMLNTFRVPSTKTTSMLYNRKVKV